MSGIPLLNEKCTGAFVASAIGDALGWPNESRSGNNIKSKPLSDFIEWQRHTGGRFWSHTEKILAGEYSDDTQMNLAVSRSLLSGREWSNYFTSCELPFWLEYERGGGGATLRAAKNWKNNVEPWKANSSKDYFSAGGNGAAMRILPHVIYHVRLNDFAQIAEEVAIDATITHGHPRAIIGAMCYAYALYYLVVKKTTLSFGELVAAIIEAKNKWGCMPSVITTGKLSPYCNNSEYIKLWDDIKDKVVQNLEFISRALNKGVLDSDIDTLTQIGCYDKRINGAGDIAAITAIYLASKYANNPMLGIKTAANAIGSDTDTIASMTGGLLGAVCGMEWIPAEWKIVQDFDCIDRMSNFLLLDNGISAVKEYVANNKNEKFQWEQTPIGTCKKIATNNLTCGKTGMVYISKYITSIGQTIYRKEYFRTKAFNNPLPKVLENSNSVYTLTINSIQAQDMLNDMDLGSVNFASILKILNMVNSGIQDITIIAQKVQVDKGTVRKIVSLIMAKK